MSPTKNVYFFGDGKADGREDMKNLLGGKGANLAEMTNLKVPVPAGFTITTEVCTYYYENGRKYPPTLKGEVDKALARVEKIMGSKFGDPDNPLLVSVRSGARSSMPGMMDTVLNIGLTEKTIPGLIRKTNNPRFCYDAYRRLITMYADVVMEKAAGLELGEHGGVREQLEHILEDTKTRRGYKNDTELTVEDLKELVVKFKAKVKEVIGKPFPDDPAKQLWGGIGAVFASWNGRRAISYRRIEGIPDEWGTAVNVQSMVFGNMGDTSCTGVAFTRNPATGENVFYGEYLVNAQGEDVVAGIRTPNPINKAGRVGQAASLVSMEEAQPKIYKDLHGIQKRLEKHYRNMLDIEFTVQEGRLWMLQCRVGKRNGPAAVRIAVEMAKEKLISKAEAVGRVTPGQLDELLHPAIDPAAEAKAAPLATGLPAGPGGACGQIVFSADDAEKWVTELGRKVVLVRNETSPEDVHGMHVAEAILTSKGGLTSHAALVARGWGKCCIVGCGEIKIDYRGKTMDANGRILREGDWITLNGTQGKVYEGQLPLKEGVVAGNKHYHDLMKWADEIRTLKIRTNADRPEDAAQAREFGAEGIGLTRTEHMFFGDERILPMRELIVARSVEERRKAVMKLLKFQRKDFYGILKAMAGLPVTIRLLDPPLHEFVPHEDAQIAELARELKVEAKDLKARIAQLHELNPMLGHRGCRLGITYPEITEMQARAIFEAAAQLTKEKVKVLPEVMIPLVGSVNEFRNQAAIVRRVADEVRSETKIKFKYLVGTMIELPRACLVADLIASEAEFFSFGTNDLTQTTFGFSRDDVGGFLPDYLKEGILEGDPFATLDQEGVGQLVRMGTEKGRATRPDLKVGICGEHGGDPSSIDFCFRTGLDYVSCSPFRVPIARLAAAQAVLRAPAKSAKKATKKSAPKKAKKARR
jgi:pyruvate, orthophosphate dikinase